MTKSQQYMGKMGLKLLVFGTFFGKKCAKKYPQFIASPKHGLIYSQKCKINTI